MNKVFAVVVTWNGMRFDWLDKCLGSLQTSTVPIKTIVVDNGSTDGTVDYIRNNFTEIITIENEQNLGFGQANNRGLKKALELGGQYFFLLNQDAWVNPDCVEKLTIHLKNNADYGIVSPIHLNGTGDSLDPFFASLMNSEKCPNFYSDFVLAKVKNEVYECEFINAAAWLMSRECVRKVGGFSPAFFHYGEDDNFVQRLKYKGLKIGVLACTHIFHDKKNSTTSAHSDNKEFRRRMIKLILSHPIEKFSFNHYLRFYLKEIIKNLVRVNLKKVLSLFSDYKSLLKDKRQIVWCRRQSLENNSYVFLDFK